MTTEFTRRTFALALCAGALTGGAFAQAGADNQPRRYHITVTKVKPDMVRTYEALIKNELIPALKKGGAQMRVTWRTAIFGEAFEYVSVSPIRTMAQYDGQNAVVQALGTERSAELMERMRRCYESIRSYATMVRDELSIESSGGEPPKVALVASVRGAPGRGLELEGFMKNEILPLMKKAGIKDYWVHQTILGGDPNEFVTVTPYPNMAELDKPSPAIRVLGREGWLKLTAKIAGVVASVDYSVTRFDPELSFLPAQ